MQIRDRIKELRRVKACDLRPNPKNWRTHPDAQKDVLRGVLSEIGYADALLAREHEDGTLELVDGHLRAETTPDQEVPVLVLDLSAEEADKLLAILDPLSSLAGTDGVVLNELLETIETENNAINALFESMSDETSDLADQTPTLPPEIDVPELFQVVVECRDEDEQREVHDRLIGEGRVCRLMNL